MKGDDVLSGHPLTNMIDSKHYFTTGEFAKLCNVKKQTLFHYDQIGIFTPSIVGENGYRYYSYTQLETFAVLQMMKDLHVPLKEIKEHMENRSPQRAISMLADKQKQIDQMIARLQVSREYIKDKIELTKEGMNAQVGNVLIQQLPDEYMITTDYDGRNEERAAEEAANDLFQNLHSMGITSAYDIGAMIPVAEVREDYYRYARFYTVVDIKNLKKSQRKLATVDAGGPHLVYYENDGYKSVNRVCMELKSYADAHNLKLGEYFYEDVVLDDFSRNGYYDYMIKISVRIEE